MSSESKIKFLRKKYRTSAFHKKSNFIFLLTKLILYSYFYGLSIRIKDNSKNIILAKSTPYFTGNRHLKPIFST
ncbi:MAG: hypothetical protein RSF13_10190, partial [Clostridiales bacterium]